MSVSALFLEISWKYYLLLIAFELGERWD
jgi:hypothetical protein